MKVRIIFLIGLCIALSSCNRGQENAIPTLANAEDLATAVVLTRNAPPPGFEEVSFPEVDANLRTLPGWYYNVSLTFSGTFAGTSRATNAHITAQVWYNQLGSAWRVVASASGEMFGEDSFLTYEAVRLGPDSYLVSGGVCETNTDAARAATELGAGTLIGGVNRAVYTGGQPDTINNARSWPYAFENTDLNLPAVLSSGGTLSIRASELLVAPEYNAVVRYFADLDVQNAVLFERPNDSLPPVTGQITIRYDLYDIGVVPNLSIPNGC